MQSNNPDPHLSLLASALERLRLNVQRQGDHGDDDDDALLLEHPRRSQTLRLSRAWLSALLPGLETDQDHDRRARINAFARGLAAAFTSAPTDFTAKLPFKHAAGVLLPLIQRPAFGQGLLCATGLSTWARPLTSDLSVFYVLELVQGHTFLTDPLLQTWGVTSDRVTSAARSLLYHRTRDDTPEPAPDWETWSLQDGYDASRLLILEDLDFRRARAGLLVALPHAGALMVQPASADPSARGRLQHQAQTAWSDAPWPLSPHVYTLEPEGLLRPLETPSPKSDEHNPEPTPKRP